LIELAAEYELVLVCHDEKVAGALLRSLREKLPRREVVALLIDGDLSRRERDVTAELLNDGAVPLIITVGSHRSARLINWHWLGAHRVVALPSAAISPNGRPNTVPGMGGSR
jgi:hypothetical protein